MAIQVTIEDHTGNTSRAAKMVENAPIARLLPAVISALGLPIIDSAGRPMVYHLSHNDRQLQDDETLEAAGVAQGDTLTIVPVMTAGALAAAQELVELGEVLRAHRPVPGLPRGVRPSSTGLQVQIAPDAMARVWAQAHAEPGREVGGLLVGTVYEEPGQFFVAVEEALEANHTAASPGSLTFTLATWLDLLPRRRRRAEAAVLGWYHSHPGHGIFLSRSDMHIQRNFFHSAPWYIALVVDPASERWGVFGWSGDEVVRCADSRVQ
ncbi:MAG: hypothetical protein OHK0015_38540 [Chloroflexi bacterium OHK40]